MSYIDFLRAMTPYNYGEIKDGKEYLEIHKDKLKEVFALADPDGDGSISFTEFFFFVTIL